MPPNKSSEHPRKMKQVLPDDEVVISGIAGRFPNSDNVQQLRKNLFNKVDLVSDDNRRRKPGNPKELRRSGTVNNVDKFDSLFFGVLNKHAYTMDPMCRMLLEHAYEAIIDAGINPTQIPNRRIGVFIGLCMSESEKYWLHDTVQFDGSAILGSFRAVYANRISNFFNLTGPSYTVDSACSSSLYALEQAYRSIREGVCDAAIVGGTHLCLNPVITMQYQKLGALSSDGRCKSFSEDADGYVRSEAISVVLLQRARDARRVYATVVHGKSNCDGFKEEGLTFPSTDSQSRLMRECYAECGISPASVDYIEAHGTGTRVGDVQEANAIDQVFAEDRSGPLLIGSVKSNLGHTEGASGMCAIAKVIIAMESGVLPPNLHFNQPREAIKGFAKGTLKVVTDPTPWKLGYAGISSFGLSGANAHILLKSHSKEKANNGMPSDDLPRLVVLSGRTVDAVSTMLSYLESKPVDVEYVKLLHDIHSSAIKGHLYRGYTLLPPRGIKNTPVRDIQVVPSTREERRPVCFVFSGMGSQWPGMGEALLHLPVFAAAIRKCDVALKPYGIDIYHIIAKKDETIFNNILNSFVGIAAVQIGLVDVLSSIGIKPNYIIGHSVGELGCAYADGCFTAEQMILAAYFRGVASLETKFVFGKMAAVDLGYKELKDLCPSGIEIACHNSIDNATISGPTELVEDFIAELDAKKIFVKEVNVSNIPYHSHYIAPAGPKLLSYLHKVIPQPKPRSRRWLSTSVPIDKWDISSACFSSAEYHTNNLLNSVLFEETSTLIPSNAITIEIAPRGILQPILRRSLGPNVTNIALTQMRPGDNLQILLEAFGKMFNAGLNFELANLYPHVVYPVSRNTPMISPLIKWDHSDDWFVPYSKFDLKDASGERNIQVSLTDDTYKFVAGHVVDGRHLFPAAGYLVLTWETFAIMHGVYYNDISVVFENIKFLKGTIIPEDGFIKFTVSILKGSGRFEVSEDGSVVVAGNIRIFTKPDAENLDIKLIADDGEEEVLKTRDVYTKYKLRGYDYSGIFQGIKSANIKFTKGHITWYQDWTAFMDNMLQMYMLREDIRTLTLATAIKKLVIDTKSHNSYFSDDKQEIDFPVYTDKNIEVVVSGGVEIYGVEMTAIPRNRISDNIVLEEYKFVPYIDNIEYGLHEIVRITTRICLENSCDMKVKSIELINETDQIETKRLLSPWISQYLRDVPLVQADINIISSKMNFEDEAFISNVSLIDLKETNADASAHLVIGTRLLANDVVDSLNLLLLELKPGGFLLTRERDTEAKYIQKLAEAKGFNVILIKKSGNEVFILLKKKEPIQGEMLVVNVNSLDFTWLEKMQKTVQEEIEKEKGCTRIILVSQGDIDTGALGFLKSLKHEPGGESVRGIVIQDSGAPTFSLQNTFYLEQIQKDLAICVLHESGCWGSYTYLPLPPLEPKSVQHAFVNQFSLGDLNSLTWLEGPIQPTVNKTNVVNVFYAAINSKDVMIVTGKLAVEVQENKVHQDGGIGIEFSGVDTSGKRCMGIIQQRCISNLCIADPDFTYDVPDSWTLEDAVTVPYVYATCFYSLYMKGRMTKRDKILIHEGSGGIGQAAIYLALHEGCEIFTTVDSPEKGRFIREKFPQIKEDHIGSSHDNSFVHMLKQQTNGYGVDIILNSRTEETLQASISCLADGGRFLQIGKFNLAINNPMSVECFLREISFHGVFLDHLFDNLNENKLALKKLMDDGVKSGTVKPLTRTVFPKDQIEAAFRCMTAGKHVGKVVIQVRKQKEPLNGLISALPRYYCLPNRSYIILGGIGGFGLELADWLVLRGARNLILVSRSGIKTGYQKLRIYLWRQSGVRIVVASGKDVAKRDDCQSIIEMATILAPVDGIFNLAAVLRDAVWYNQTVESFDVVFRGKAWATKQLDDLSREMCPNLRHFVVFSSGVCGRGNAGQTNYGMANSVMERICERRTTEGLPGLAIQWGPIGDVGIVVDMDLGDKEIIVGKIQRMHSCLETLDILLLQKQPIVSSIVVGKKTMDKTASINMVDSVINIMGLRSLDRVNLNTSLAELGMDSMTAIEIKQTLEHKFDIFLSAKDIRNLSFSKLQKMTDMKTDKTEKTGGHESTTRPEILKTSCS